MISQPQLGQILKEKRLSLSVGLRQASKIAKIRHSHLDLIERGSVTPNVATLCSILKSINGNDLLMERIFEAHPQSSLEASLLAEKIVAQIFVGAGFEVEFPTPRKGVPDLWVKLPGGLVLDVDVRLHKSRPGSPVLTD
jgi:hypothetical protein